MVFCYDFRMLNNETLLKENAELKAQLLDWKNKYYSILEQFKLSQQRQFASSTEKNIYQPDFFDEAGVHEEKVEENAIAVPGHTRSKPKRRPLPENLPREVILHDISEAEKTCECGCLKERFGEEITEQLEVVRPKITVIQHVRPKYSCKQCQICVTIAPMPNLLLPKSMATPSLISFTLVS